MSRGLSFDSRAAHAALPTPLPPAPLAPSGRGGILATSLAALTLLAACAHRPPAPPQTFAEAEDPDLRALGLDSGAFHLELHPDARCRRDWRPATVAMTYEARRPTSAEIERSALHYLGRPYVYGGVGENGMDCSGFVNRIYAEHGYDLPRTAREQAKVGLVVESQGDLAPGDLLFFANGGAIDHVALYLGGEQFIHAASGRGHVTLDRLSSTYYRTRWVGARRILALPPGRYSDAGGSARDDVLFDDDDEITDRFGEGPGPCAELAF